MFGRSGTAIEFLTDWQIGDGLLRIVREARQQLTLVSPYNRHWGHLKREVEAAQRRGVAVAAYYRAEDPAHAPEYEGASITPVRMLHAKIYANEKVALVATMNLVETSAAYSREVGLLVRDPKLRREIDEYVQSLADAAGADQAAAPSSLVQQRPHPVRQWQPCRRLPILPRLSPFPVSALNAERPKSLTSAGHCAAVALAVTGGAVRTKSAIAAERNTRRGSAIRYAKSAASPITPQ